MATLQIHLGEELKERLAARTAENGFGSVEAYIEWLLKSDLEDTAVADEELENLLLKRLENSPDIAKNAAFVDQFKREVAQRRQPGKSA